MGNDKEIIVADVGSYFLKVYDEDWQFKRAIFVDPTLYVDDAAYGKTDHIVSVSRDSAGNLYAVGPDKKSGWNVIKLIDEVADSVILNLAIGDMPQVFSIKVISDKIYVVNYNASDYRLTRYDLDGTYEDTIATGLGPNNIYTNIVMTEGPNGDVLLATNKLGDVLVGRYDTREDIFDNDYMATISGGTDNAYSKLISFSYVPEWVNNGTLYEQEAFVVGIMVNRAQPLPDNEFKTPFPAFDIDGESLSIPGITDAEWLSNNNIDEYGETYNQFALPGRVFMFGGRGHKSEYKGPKATIYPNDWELDDTKRYIHTADTAVGELNLPCASDSSNYPAHADEEEGVLTLGQFDMSGTIYNHDIDFAIFDVEDEPEPESVQITHCLDDKLLDQIL